MSDPIQLPIASSAKAEAEAEFIRLCLKISGLENRLAIARNRAKELGRQIGTTVLEPLCDT